MPSVYRPNWLLNVIPRNILCLGEQQDSITGQRAEEEVKGMRLRTMEDAVGDIETRRKTDGSGQRVFASTIHLPASIHALRIL